MNRVSQRVKVSQMFANSDALVNLYIRKLYFHINELIRCFFAEGIEGDEISEYRYTGQEFIRSESRILDDLHMVDVCFKKSYIILENNREDTMFIL